MIFCMDTYLSKYTDVMMHLLPDDMPAHIRTLVTDSGLTVPVLDGRLALGTWQGIYLIEQRDLPHRREMVLAVVGR